MFFSRLFAVRKTIVKAALLSLSLPAMVACSIQAPDPESVAPDSEEASDRGQEDWGYWGPGAPNHWGSLSPECALCAAGLHQSPIDISGYAEDSGAPELRFNYSQNAAEVKHNGKISHVEYGAGNTLTVGGVTYQLVSMHIHVHAEHQVDGQLFSAEMHLVHSREDGALGVVGQIYRLGEPDPVVQALIDAYPEPGQSRHTGFTLNAADFVPADLGYFSYEGSLTTPPCSEGVSWYVLREIKTISQQQVNGIAALHNGFNHRPIQGRNGRAVVSSGQRPSG